MKKARTGTADRTAGKAEVPASKGETVAVRGRVLDPDGKPVAGAQIYLSIPKLGLAGEPERLGAAGPDGQFEVRITKGILDPPLDSAEGPNIPASVAASAAGLGPDWWQVDRKTVNEPITLRLRRDDVPIEGRILNLEGRPVAGVVVKAVGIIDISEGVFGRLRRTPVPRTPRFGARCGTSSPWARRPWSGPRIPTPTAASA